MKYIVDNDLHIHSKVSLCSNDPLQTTERILQYAEENGLKTICLTDHFWDANIKVDLPFYQIQNYSHLSTALPLPQTENVRFLFGCETELDQFCRLGILQESIDKFDFVIIPTTHFHMTDFTIPLSVKDPLDKAKIWVERLDKVLDTDLPFHKIGIAHLTCGLIDPSRENFLKTIDGIPENDLKSVFLRAAEKGVGIELNAADMSFKDSEADTVLRVYRAAKKAGCKFYLGSDAHHPNELCQAKGIFERAVSLLDLKETDKFKI